ncbi:glycosyltransferase family 1 protein [Natrinema sp. 74]|uniref:glycosyltransferase family 1 protein n=1 Tax=Natrinema sp. 74 TaxID=3384159 RepID=UPI0038D385F5
MRVLVIPELYRPDNALANGTVNDLRTLVDRWLAVDPSIHVYWLLPPRDGADYERRDVLADRERVTLIEAPSFMDGHRFADSFVETGAAEAQFRAIAERIYEPGAYVDVVVDQRVTGRYDLFKWLLELGEHDAADVRPVRLIANVHDLRLPFKRHGREYPNDAPMKAEIGAASFADRLWFKAGVDARRMREYGQEYFQEGLLDDLLEDAVETGSPLDFSQFDESYAETPTMLHIAGSGWGKKNVDDVLDVGRRLYDDYGVRTVMTNMDSIVESFAERTFVDAYPEASAETYERALRAGDLTVCASDHETMARTWFEQAASGQVLIARDRPWLSDCVPDDYRFAGSLEDLPDLAARAVEQWDDAVAENRRLLEHVREVRSPERCGRRTYEDLRDHVDERIESFTPAEYAAPIEATLEEMAGDSGVAVELPDLLERTASHTDDGAPIIDCDAVTRTDVVYALRSLGYEDTGSAGSPVFERRRSTSSVAETEDAVAK